MTPLAQYEHVSSSMVKPACPLAGRYETEAIIDSPRAHLGEEFARGVISNGVRSQKCLFLRVYNLPMFGI